MLRSVVGRLCTYGLVFGLNALPVLGLGAGGPIAPPLTIPVDAPDEPEGEASLPVRWSAIPALPVPDAPPADVAPPAVPPAPAPVATRARAAEPAPPAAPDAGGGGSPATTGEAADAPPAGDGGPVAAKPGGAKGKGNSGRRPRGAGPSGGKSKACEAPHPQIRAGDDGILEIDRALVDAYTKNLETFMQLGYSRPYDEEGLEGWYISGFSCKSPVAKAGFQRGDVLLTVNGRKTRSWMGVFLLYQKLKHKDEFEVELVRKGEPVTLRFRVVG